MKKFYVAVLALSVSTSVFSQKDSMQVINPAEDAKNLPYNKSVAVKFSPAGLVFGKVQVGGELNYKHKKSVTLYVGIPIEQAIPSTLKDKMFENEKEKANNNITFKTFSIIGGYRMYMGKRDMTGLYFEPYLKYLKNTTVGNYTSDNNTPFLLTSEYSGFGVGAQLGVQFMLAKRVVFDMFILGPEANMAKHTAILQDLGPGSWLITPQEQKDAEQELKNVMKDIPLIGDKIEVKSDAKNKTVSTEFSGFLPGFRGGISIGVRF